MKVFFWLSGAAYVFLYFWAAYIYEGFDMWLAIALFVAAVALIYWQRKRSQLRQSADAATAPASAITEPDHVHTPRPLSFWASPLPYMLILVTVILVSLLF